MVNEFSLEDIAKIITDMNISLMTKMVDGESFKIPDFLENKHSDFRKYIEDQANETGRLPSEVLLNQIGEVDKSNPKAPNYRPTYTTMALDLDNHTSAQINGEKSIEDCINQDDPLMHMLLDWAQDVLDEGVEDELAELLYVIHRDKLKNMGDELFEKVRGLRDYLGRIRSERKKPKIPEIPTADHIIEEIKLSNKSLPSMCYDAIRNIEKNRMRKRLYDGLKGMNAEDPEYEATCKIMVDDILLQLMQNEENSKHDEARKMYKELWEEYDHINNLTIHGIPARIGTRAFPSFYQKEGIAVVCRDYKPEQWSLEDIQDHQLNWLELEQRTRELREIPDNGLRVAIVEDLAGRIEGDEVQAYLADFGRDQLVEFYAKLKRKGNEITFLFDDCGTGKTAQMGLSAEYMGQLEAIAAGISVDKARAVKTLVITPNTVKETFAEELKNYFQGKYKIEEDIVVLNGATRKEQYVKLDTAAFTIVNYELIFRKDWKLNELDEFDISPDEIELVKENVTDKKITELRKEVKALMKRPGNTYQVKAEELSQLGREEIVELYAKILHLNEHDSVLKKLIDQDYQLLCVDESQNAKGQTTHRGLAVRELMNKVSRKVISTGTPFPLGRKDLDLYFYATGFDSRGKDLNEILAGDARYVRAYLKPYMLRRRSEDVLDLPSRCEREVLVPLDDTIKSMYEYILNRGDRLKPLQRLILLRKIALDPNLLGSRVRGEDIRHDDELLTRYSEVFDIDFQAPKYVMLESMIEDYFKAVDEYNQKRDAGDLPKNRKVVVCTSFFKNGVTDKLADYFGQWYVTDRIDGDVPALKKKGQQISDRQAAMKRFNQGNTEVLFVSLPTMKEGISLVGASYGIALDLPYTWDEFYQWMKRLHREGQKHDVDIDVLLTENTIDEGIWELVNDRKVYYDLILNSGLLTPQEQREIKNWEKPQENERIKKRLKRAANEILRDLFGKGRKYVTKAIGISEEELKDQNPSEEVKEKIRRAETLAIELNRSKVSLGINPWVAEYIKQHGYERLLDLGGGNGILSRALGREIYNVDMNPFQLRLAEKHSPLSRNFLGDFYNLPFDDKYFDSVSSILSLHYTSDDDLWMLMNEVNRVIVPDGKFYVGTHRNLYPDEHLEKVNEALASDFGLEFLCREEKGCYHLWQYKKSKDAVGQDRKLVLFEKPKMRDEDSEEKMPQEVLDSLEASALYVRREGDFSFYVMKDSPTIGLVDHKNGRYVSLPYEQLPSNIVKLVGENGNGRT